jgi:RND family efflux transporter MFP subunit
MPGHQLDGVLRVLFDDAFVPIPCIFERHIVLHLVFPRWAQIMRRVAPAVTVAALLQGCAKSAPPPPAAPVSVTVANPVQREVVEWDTYTGYLEAPQSVNVAARVSGLIMDEPFTEGAIVKKGDVLFVIDDRPFKADLDAKLADQAKDEAQLAIDEVNLQRLIEPLKINAVSQQDFDNAKATRDQAAAVVEGAKAAVELSRLNLEWCKVTSPIEGRVSNKMVTVGNLINGGAGQATLLTTVQSIDPIYCYVDVDEHSVLKYEKLAAEKKRVSAREAKIPCYLETANEDNYPHVGVVDFVDNHIDPTTGTRRARGVFANPSDQLVPGFFGSIRVSGSGKYQTLLVPDSAIGNDQSERTLLLVDKDNVVVPRIVQVGALFGGLRSIISGLSAGDRVIINGQMHSRPGATVAPNMTQIDVDPSVFASSASSVAQAPPGNGSPPSGSPSSTTQPTTNPTLGSIQ